MAAVVVVVDAACGGGQQLGVWLRRVMRGDECGLGLSAARDRIMLLLSACNDEVAMLKSSQPMSCDWEAGGERERDGGMADL